MVPLKHLRTLIENDSYVTITLTLPDKTTTDFTGRVVLEECTDDVSVLYTKAGINIFKNSDIINMLIISKDIIDEYEVELNKQLGNDKNSIFYQHLRKVTEHLENADSDY